MMRHIVIIILAFIALSTTASATVLHVPSQYASIQNAIYASINGDTVLVAPGIYQEHLNYFGKAIVVMSQAGAESTIIEKQFDGISMVYFENGEDTTSVIDGFTIRNATATGIKCYQSSPIIQNCIIEGNIKHPSEAQGGGITAYQYSSPIIRNNVIRGNSTPGAMGGGLYVYTPSDSRIFVIENNQFYENSANVGGAIGMFNWISSISLRNNVIYHNSSGGGALHINHSAQNNVIAQNTIVDNHGSSGAHVNSCVN